jgi:lipopolysaccharide export system permease protein
MPAITITAEVAELRSDRNRNVLKIILQNGTVEVEDSVSIQFPDDTYEQDIPLQEASQAGELSRVPSRLPLRVIPDEIAGQKEVIRRMEQELAARAGYEMLQGDFDALAGREWKTRARALRLARQRLCRLRTEPHRRWSAGFSCLCFAFVGAPMAIRLRNRDFLTSFFLCFLPILVVYYPLLIWGVDGAKSGSLPAYSVWTGNLLLLGWGAYLLRKVLRY